MFQKMEDLIMSWDYVQYHRCKGNENINTQFDTKSMLNWLKQEPPDRYMSIS